MNDTELLNLARAVVPDHLKPLGKIVRAPTPGPHLAAAVPGIAEAPDEDALIAQLAKEVGATLSPNASDSADVEFVEHTPVGTRATVVLIRNGKVAQIVKRA